ncbi:MAG: hypothetical protein ABTD50_00280 [Polyangiaceae bacterium]
MGFRPWEHAIEAAAATVALGVATSGCDPAEDPPVAQAGPEFLIVAPAQEQPSPSLGTVMFAQARGGDFLGIVTHGCSYDVGSLLDVQSSCTYLPVADALRFIIEPTTESCLVEARLYLMCSESCEGGAPMATQTEPLFSIGYCDDNATLVETVAVTVAPPTGPADAGSRPDAAVPVDGSREGDSP